MKWLMNRWKKWIQRNAIKEEEEETRIISSFTRNPLLKYPRNINCFCGSGKKFKVCCFKTIPHFISKREAKKNKQYLGYVNQCLEQGLYPK